MSEQSQFSEREAAASQCKPGRRRFVVWFASVLLISTLVPNAGAQSQGRLLDAPRADGTVGERFDGFAVARAAVSSDVASMVESINAERRKIYTDRAASQKATVAEVGKIYAAEILKSAPAGTWFLGEGGQWSRK